MRDSLAPSLPPCAGFSLRGQTCVLLEDTMFKQLSCFYFKCNQVTDVSQQNEKLACLNICTCVLIRVNVGR